MSPTEMVHTGASLTQARPGTPPSSPTDSFEHVVTLSSAQQFIEIVSAIVAMQMASSPASKRTCSHVPSENPTFQASERPLTLEHLEELLLKLVGAKSTDSAGKSEDSESTSSEDTRQEDVVAPASRLEFKTVYEVYVSSSVQVPFTADKLIFIQLGLEGAQVHHPRIGGTESGRIGSICICCSRTGRSVYQPQTDEHY